MRDGTIRRTRRQKWRDDYLKVAVANWQNNNRKWRTIPNTHGSAYDALMAWSCDNGGSLWHTFPVSRAKRITIHGVWLRDWSLVTVIFNEDTITVGRMPAIKKWAQFR